VPLAPGKSQLKLPEVKPPMHGELIVEKTESPGLLRCHVRIIGPLHSGGDPVSVELAADLIAAKGGPP
jgi:hypothetical protein